VPLSSTPGGFWAARDTSEQVNFLQRAFASADRVFGVLDTVSRTADRADALAEAPEDWTEVAFEDVTFVYDGGARALDGVSFRMRRGEKVALVGLSGGGKTTITNLLLRFYEPSSGRITIDGTDIRAFQQKAWREKIGLVLQESPLPRTVEENSARAGTEISRENLSGPCIVGLRMRLRPGGFEERA
jgi:ABC-type multidrug transport system fused ATPase/permease subunit